MKTNHTDQIIRVKMIGFAMAIIVIGLLAAGCSGSSGSSNSDVPDAAPGLLEGTFVDSPVQGLDYYSTTHSGVTDEDGHFMYYEGEMMTFAIGDVIIGEAMAEEVMTPMHFIDESERPFDVTHPVVTNMGRFLQSIDADGDPENGITISDDVKAEIDGRMIDFHQSVMGFETDPDTEALFDTLNGMNMNHNGLRWRLVDVERAQQHMNDHMGEYLGPYMDDNDTGNSPGNSMDDQMDDDMGFDMGDDNTMGNEPGNMDSQVDDNMGFGTTDDGFMGNSKT